MKRRHWARRISQYVFSDFNLWDLASIGLFFYVVVYHVQVESETQRQLANGITEDKYYELDYLARLVSFERDAIAAFVLATFGKILKHVQLIPVAGPAMQAILHTVSNKIILIFLLFFTGFTLVVSLSFHFAFGTRYEAYYSYERAIFTVLRTLFGDLDFSFVDGNRGHLGPRFAYGFAGVLWIILLVMGNLIIMNLTIGVISAVYEEARRSYSRAAWEDEITKMMEYRVVEALPLDDKNEPGWKKLVRVKWHDAVKGLQRYKLPTNVFSPLLVHEWQQKRRSKPRGKKETEARQIRQQGEKVADALRRQDEELVALKLQLAKLQQDVGNLAEGVPPSLKEVRDKLSEIVERSAREKEETQFVGRPRTGAPKFAPRGVHVEGGLGATEPSSDSENES